MKYKKSDEYCLSHFGLKPHFTNMTYKAFLILSVCDEPMLESGKIADIPGIGAPGPDGLVNIPVELDGTTSVTFTTPISELTQIKVKPTNVLVDDVVRVTVTLTDTDGVNTDLVSEIPSSCL